MRKLDMRLANNLKRLMKETGHTSMRKLSLDANLGETFVRDAIVGRASSPKLASLERICNVLNRDISELLIDDKTSNSIINTDILSSAISIASGLKEDVLKDEAQVNNAEFSQLITVIYEKLSKGESLKNQQILKLLLKNNKG